jgi:hypothetical protein
MDASVAGEIEQAFAKAGHVVVSNSKNHRMLPDVPLLVPEINPEHLGLIEVQRKNRGWSGAIVTNPNCSTIALTMGLAPLKPFGIKLLGTKRALPLGRQEAGDPGRQVVGLEDIDLADAALAGDQPAPSHLDATPERRDQAEAGHHDTSHHMLYPVRPISSTSGPTSSGPGPVVPRRAPRASYADRCS